MTLAEIAAFIGAAAWMPHLSEVFAKSKVIITPDEFIDIGFTTYGPILNLKLDISVEKKSAIIDSIVISLSAKNKKYISKEFKSVNVIDRKSGNDFFAIQLNPYAMQHISVRFHDKNFNELFNPRFEELRHKIYQNNSIQKLTNSVHVSNLILDIKNFFYWNTIEYCISFKVNFRSNKTALLKDKYCFTLSQEQSENLRQNLRVIEQDIKRDIIGGEYDEKEIKHPFSFNWIRSTLKRTRD